MSGILDQKWLICKYLLPEFILCSCPFNDLQQCCHYCHYTFTVTTVTVTTVTVTTKTVIIESVSTITGTGRIVTLITSTTESQLLPTL